MVITIILAVALIASLGLNALMQWLHFRERIAEKEERSELHTRLASKSLAEAEYYLKEYPKHLKHREEELKSELEIKKNMTDEERKIEEEVKKF